MSVFGNLFEHAHNHNDSLPHKSHGPHGLVDPITLTSARGMWATQWSFFALVLTGIFQFVVVIKTGSVALLADTVHNFGDAATAIPLWIAFALGNLKSTRRFTYGLGRLEDLAGVAIVLIILFSAAVAGYQVVHHLLYPQTIENVWAVILASLVGFVGNELVAKFRIRIGREIGSAALVADGYHARIDGLTSLAVLAGAVGVKLGYPLADPIAGCIITLMILHIVWDSGRTVFIRVLDGIDPGVLDEIRHAVSHVKGVEKTTEVRVRWLGHRLIADINIAVDPNLTVNQGHEIANDVRHQLLHHLRYLSNATIHVDPTTAAGEAFHKIEMHAHDQLPPHSH